MEKAEFHYRQKPSPISFLVIYVVCFVCAYFLIKHSAAVSKTVMSLLSLIHVPRVNLLQNLPYGKLLSIPFIVYGLRIFLWNIMSYYEIDTSRIRLLTGHLARREDFVLVSDIHEISFKQNLLEAPFQVGSLLLKTRAGEFNIRGVYRVKQVVEDLRRKTSYY